MYKPPENTTNRVKSIKNKFEEKCEKNLAKTFDKMSLERQLSDPSNKRNIKRTPAFRLDKNTLQQSPFQRSNVLNKSQNSTLKNHTKNEPFLMKNPQHPVLVKSKTSLDFDMLRNRFNTNRTSDLYTEPIPKSQRTKTVEEQPEYTNLIENFHTAGTLKITDTVELNNNNNKLKGSSSTALEKLDTLLELTKQNSLKKPPRQHELTDTLKKALKRPLPKGPAPEKPPRTFVHPVKHDETHKRNPKYMLNKLETALRNNKLKYKKPLVKTDFSTTSGEDSETEVASSTSNRLVQALNPLNLNCLNGGGGNGGVMCLSSPYSKLNESKSEFFVSVNRKIEEPVYAEPWHFHEGLKMRNRSASSDRNTSNTNRNSLYYMSSPVLCSNNGSTNSTRTTPSPSGGTSSRLLNTFESNRIMNNRISLRQKDVPLSNAIAIRSEKEHTPSPESLTSNEEDSTMVDIKKLITVFEPRLEAEDDEETISQNSTEKHDVDEQRKMSVDDPEVNKFRTYVRNVSVYSKTRKRPKNTLFQVCLIVEWNADVRRIKFQYPHYVDVPHKIEDLCFPDATYGPLDKTINAQCYSLVITNDRGERTFGYCRRVVPEGSNNCIPIVYCILSEHKSPRFYKKLLIELESRHGISESHRNNLLDALYYNKFPLPGETIRIKLSQNEENNFEIINGKFEDDERTEEITITLNLHNDPLFELSDLRDLHHLPMEILLKIFASLLLERKVILISCLLSKLSSCVDGLQAMIYPFTWPHSFIPVLPKSLWEFVEAPTPIICGILSVEVINKHEIEHGIVVDLDEKCILKEEGDEDNALGNCMIKAWRKSMAIAKNIPVEKETHSYHLTEAYIHIFAIALKNYKDYIVHGNFQKEAFIRSNKRKSVRRFLKWFTDTTMFLTFVDAVITNSQDFSLFDKKLALYGSENSNIILDKLLDWKLSNN